jgi:hypothetical protein
VYTSECNDRKLKALPMNLIDRSVEIVGALIGEPSCADAITAIDKDGTLHPRRSAIGQPRCANWDGISIGHCL